MLRSIVSPLGPIIVNIWGQSNAVGHATWPSWNPNWVITGTYAPDNRVTYYTHFGAPTAGVLVPFAPNLTTGSLNGKHGIEIGLGTGIADATGRKVVISKGAVDATTIDTWLPASGANWPVQVLAGGVPLPTTEKQVHCVTLHGESDATAGTTYATYLADLALVHAGIRAFYSLNTRFHIVLCNSLRGGSVSQIRQAQTDWATGDGNADTIDLDDLNPGVSGGGSPGGGDGTHYDSAQFTNVIAPRVLAKILASL